MIFVDSNVPMYIVGAPHPTVGCSRVFSFDAGFDSCPGIVRVS